jgi:hypothetical protein
MFCPKINLPCRIVLCGHGEQVDGNVESYSKIQCTRFTLIPGHILLPGGAVATTLLSNSAGQPQQQHQMLRQVAQHLMTSGGVAPSAPQLRPSMSPTGVVAGGVQSANVMTGTMPMSEGPSRSSSFSSFSQLSPLGSGEKRALSTGTPSPNSSMQQQFLQQQLKLQEQLSIQQIQQQLMASAPPPGSAPPVLPGPFLPATSPATSPPAKKRLKMEPTPVAADVGLVMAVQGAAPGFASLQGFSQNINVHHQTGMVMSPSGDASNVISQPLVGSPQKSMMMTMPSRGNVNHPPHNSASFVGISAMGVTPMQMASLPSGATTTQVFSSVILQRSPGSASTPGLTSPGSVHAAGTSMGSTSTNMYPSTSPSSHLVSFESCFNNLFLPIFHS